MVLVVKIGFLYIIGTILFTVYGLLVLKWRTAKYGNLPEDLSGKFGFLFNVLIDPWVISGLVSAMAASFFWIAAMTKFDLSYAYPFMSLSFVLVLFLSALLFHEPVTVPKLLGLLLIISGIVVSSRSL
jgi:multidrug transporter EmrE-like cation transporter